MPAHELGHVLGFHHEHARWDRDEYVTIHYEHLKPERKGDYDWIPRTHWLASSPSYDYYSIMHYRVCWSSACESQCKDGDGTSPCAVIDPVGTKYDGVIGQWGDNGISAMDAERTRQAYGSGRTIYVNPASAGDSSGTLLNPYHDFVQACKAAGADSRFIVFSSDGSFSTRALPTSGEPVEPPKKQ